MQQSFHLFLKIFTFIIIWTSSLANEKPKLEWWQTTVFYHLYPRSFKDSNGDGVGDFRGMIEKLPQHLHDMGVGAVWISPVFKSPMRDFGYDISNFTQFEGIFGTTEEFLELKTKLHSLDIKILLDFVPNHCSIDHEWFQNSVDRVPGYEDFFTWVDPKGYDNGVPIPPNNWRSEFSGSAWTFHPKRNQFYLHQFLSSQPDMNYRNPQVVEAMKNVLRYWLGQGVDGFRLDAVPFLFEDPLLRDNPYKDPKITDDPSAESVYRKYSQDLPPMYDMCKQWRQVLDTYTQKDGKIRVMLFEAYVNLTNSLKFYDGLDNAMPFNFNLQNNLNKSSTAEDFHYFIHSWMDKLPIGKWTNWVLGNHDVPRISARMGSELVDAMNMLSLLLPGTPVVYNGEEIGMEDTQIQWEETVDNFGKNCGKQNYWKCSRDPERTPYQWDASLNAGFSTNPKPWLPVNPNYYYLNLEAQKSVFRSHYNIFKRLVKLRSKNTFLYGSWKTLPVSKSIFTLTRYLEGEDTYILVINLSNFIEVVSLNKITSEPKLFVHTPSINSEYNVADEITQSKQFTMRPKSSIVLTTSRQSIEFAKEPPGSAHNDEL